MRRAAFLLAGLAMVALMAVDGAPTAARQAAPEGGTADWRSLSPGTNHTCGIRTTGRLYCWGYDGFGQLGLDSAPGAHDEPTTQVVGGRTDWRQVSAGAKGTCATTTGGRLFCWGDDGFGQVGNGLPNANVDVPTEVSGARTDWRSVTVGDDATCALRTTGRLFCWGRDNRGQLGNGMPFADTSVPVEVAGARTDWVQVSAGFSSACARRSTRRIYCFGSDGVGQLGNSPVEDPDQPAPVELAGARTDWTQVSVGDRTGCARRASGRLFCWGNEDYGELGNGQPFGETVFTPVEVAGARTDWVAVDVGGLATCARRASRRLFCWGGDFEGSVGDGLPLTDRAAPSEVVGARTDWAAFGSGDGHACALRTNLRAFCWGLDERGQLGNGSPQVSTAAPVQVNP